MKAWRCECQIMWHTCRLHRYAKANEGQHSKQTKVTNGQSSAAENPQVKRAKADLGRNDTDEVRTGNQKRKRDTNENEHTDNDENSPEAITNLKRKRDFEPNELINLGHFVHKNFNPNLLALVLKRRFMFGK